MSSNEAATRHIMHSDCCVLGFDIGGTKTVGALADARGNLLAQAAVPTVPYEGQPNYAQMFARLRDDLVARAAASANQISAAGLSVAGVVAPGTGRVVTAPNLSREGFDLRAIVEAALGVPTVIENDVNLAAVGEHRSGAARGCRHFVFVAIGTGIGAGIFINGRLYRGAHNAAGEAGYLYVHGLERIGPDGLGSLEKRASGPGITALARERIQSAARRSSLASLPLDGIRGKDVWAAASEGDPLASEVISETLDTIALALANMAFLFDPEMIVLGGGVSGVGDALLLPLRERLQALLVRPVSPRLELSALGNRAQLWGAVYQALDACDNPRRE